MFTFSQSLIEDAKNIAKEMLENNTEIMPIPFGARMNAIFVATNHHLIVPIHYFEMGGKAFIIGGKSTQH